MLRKIYEKILFLLAAAFNLSAAAVLLFRPDIILARLNITDPGAKLLARSLASSVTAWGIAYLLVAFNPLRFREFVRLGVLSKTLFFAIYAFAFFDDQITLNAFAPAIMDLVLAGLFAEYLWRTRTQ